MTSEKLTYIKSNQATEMGVEKNARICGRKKEANEQSSTQHAEVCPKIKSETNA